MQNTCSATYRHRQHLPLSSMERLFKGKSVRPDRYALFGRWGGGFRGGRCGRGRLGGGGLRGVRDAEIVVALALLGDEGVDDLRGELGGVVAPVAVLPENRYDDVGVAAGSHSYEPGVGDCAFVRAVFYASADNIGGAGLAGEVDTIKMRDVGGTDGTTGDIG